MPVPLIEITRSSVIECIHNGDIAVVNSLGKLIYSAGDPFKHTYMRSTAKPIQAINVISSGAAEVFGLSEKEIAVICSSHYAEPFHLEAVNNILRKIGLTDKDLLCGTVTSLNKEYALKLARDNIKLNPTYSDCSGKHTGMLAVCRHKGYSVHDYINPGHPCQKKIIEILSDMCSIEKNKIVIGIDGCSAPVYAIPLYNMAFGYARFVTDYLIQKQYQNPTKIIFKSMNDYPMMISGTGGFCTDLIKNCSRKLIGKIGAEGVYCIGLRSEGIGIALKVESGSMDVIPPIVFHILNTLNVFNKLEIIPLKKYSVMDNKNDLNITVGKIRPVFSLTKHLT
jgi:L-asparaginase II